jgi:hypothetical protein
VGTRKGRMTVNMVDFVFIYENRRMKPVEIVLRRWGRERRRTMKGVNLRSIGSMYVNITMYSPVQLLYTNKIKKFKFWKYTLK